MLGRTAAPVVLALLLLVPAMPAGAQTLPDVLPLLPVTDGVMFPGVSNDIQILVPEHKLLVEDAVTGDSLIGLVTLRPGGAPTTFGKGDIFPVGVVTVIDDVKRTDDGRLFILVRSIMRFRVQREDQTRPYRMGHLELLPDMIATDEQATLATLRARVDELVALVDPILLRARDDEERINKLAFYLDVDLFERQGLLEQNGVIPRAQAMIELLTMKLANRPR